MSYSMCGRLAAPLCAALLAAAVVQAQETINHASVSGRVTDTQGGVIVGAQVIARHAETNVKTEAVTDVDGRFRLPYLRVGPHEVTVHRDGFADDRRSTCRSRLRWLGSIRRSQSLARVPRSRRPAARSPARWPRPSCRACH